MEYDDINRLNQRFSISEENSTLTVVEGEGFLPVILVHGRYGSAAIGLHGAHILSWTPTGQEEVLWVSSLARFQPGKAVRGGIPICWPWFGAYPDHPDLPAHGFARLNCWELVETSLDEAGRISVVLTLKAQDDNIHLWPGASTVRYRIEIGTSLKLTLTTTNPGDMPVTISQALHTYFSIGDVNAVEVRGLDNCAYLDKTDGFRCKEQHGPVRFDGEIDRIYVGTDADCIIVDPVLAREILIRKQSSRSTIVWNPGPEGAARMNDMGPQGFRKMLCVESANVGDDRVQLAPGASHSLQVDYRISSLQG